MSTPAKKQVFKAALDVPWRDWPEQLSASDTQTLVSSLVKTSDLATDINAITLNVSSGTHNCVVAAKLADGFPFFLRHIPACIYASGGFLFVVSESDFMRLLEAVKVARTCRCISFRVEAEALSTFTPFRLPTDFSTDVALMNKLIKK